MKPKDKIIQLIPAPGWVATFYADGGENLEPLVGWALTESGEIHGLIADHCAFPDKAEDASNFVEYQFRGAINA